MAGDTAEDFAQEILRSTVQNPRVRPRGSMVEGASKIIGKIAKAGESRNGSAKRANRDRFASKEPSVQNLGSLDPEERTQAVCAKLRETGEIPSVDFKPTSSKNVGFEFTTIKSDPKMTMIAQNLNAAGIPFTESFADKEKGIRRFKVHPEHARTVLELVDYLASRVPGFTRERCVNYDQIAQSLGIAKDGIETERVLETVIDHGLLDEIEAKAQSDLAKSLLTGLGYEYSASYDKATGEERFYVKAKPGQDLLADLKAEYDRLDSGEKTNIKVLDMSEGKDAKVPVKGSEAGRKKVEATKDAKLSNKRHLPAKDEKTARNQAKEVNRDLHDKVQTKVKAKK